MTPFDQQDFELDRQEAIGGPFQAHNRIGENDATLRTLLRVRGLLEGGHCKRMLAADAFGKGIDDIYDVRAVAFCITGAHSRATRRSPASDDHAWEYITTAVGGVSRLLAFNNAPETTQANVVALLDRAIAARRSAITA